MPPNNPRIKNTNCSQPLPPVAPFGKQWFCRRGPSHDREDVFVVCKNVFGHLFCRRRCGMALFFYFSPRSVLIPRQFHSSYPVVLDITHRRWSGWNGCNRKQGRSCAGLNHDLLWIYGPCPRFVAYRLLLSLHTEFLTQISGTFRYFQAQQILPRGIFPISRHAIAAIMFFLCAFITVVFAMLVAENL
jgi:hypothetical protein